jgi:hypothetical protein
MSVFGWPLVIGGMLKGVYDVLLLLMFKSVRPPEEAAQFLEATASRENDAHALRRRTGARHE